MQWVEKKYGDLVGYLTGAWLYEFESRDWLSAVLINHGQHHAYRAQQSLPVDMRTPRDKYAPWAAKQIWGALQKTDSGFQLQAMYPLFKYGTLITDWARAARPDLMRFTVHEAVDAADDWHTELEARQSAELARALVFKPAQIIKTWPDGFKYVKLFRSRDLQAIGRQLGHCYQEAAVADTYLSTARLYTLLDADNVPHVTVEMSREDETVRQCKGKGNQIPAAKYWPYIRYMLLSARVPLARWNEAVVCATVPDLVALFSQPGTSEVRSMWERLPAEHPFRVKYSKALMQLRDEVNAQIRILLLPRGLRLVPKYGRGFDLYSDIVSKLGFTAYTQITVSMLKPSGELMTATEALDTLEHRAEEWVARSGLT